MLKRRVEELERRIEPTGPIAFKVVYDGDRPTREPTHLEMASAEQRGRFTVLYWNEESKCYEGGKRYDTRSSSFGHAAWPEG